MSSEIASTSKDHGTILVVDDQPRNIQLFVTILTQQGYSVRGVNSGKMALEYIALNLPDLILLDIKMPGLDGFEVCRQLKENSATHDIPVIFLTALSNIEEKVTGFTLGAADYITKPTEPAELLSRVKTHLSLYLTRKELQKLNATLEQKVDLRTKDLALANDALKKEILYRTRAQEALLESEKRFRSLYEHAPLGYQSLDIQGNFIDVNLAWLDIFGYNENEIIGKWFGDLLPPEQIAQFKTLFSKFLTVGEIHVSKLEMVKSDGSRLLVSFDGRIGLDEKGRFLQAHCIIANITERILKEEQLKASLNEKNVLLGELYHRTKNNMQVIVALLEMQAGTTENEELQKIIQDIEYRIKAMTLVQQKVYESKNLSKIDLKAYLSDLSHLLLNGFSSPDKLIQLELDMDEIWVLIDIATPCGLVVNELLTNCFKHAFPKGYAGKISIHLHRLADREIELIIGDNGVGFTSPFDFKDVSTLGLQMVNNIVTHQLNGKITVDLNNGVQWTIRFRDDLYNERI